MKPKDAVLPNVRTTPLALDAMVTGKAKHLFESNGVYSHVELEARHEIELEKYIKRVQIEAPHHGRTGHQPYSPPAIKYQNILIQNIKGLKEIGLKDSAYSNQLQILIKISDHIAKVSELVEKMIEARKIANNITDTRTKAIAYTSQVKDPYLRRYPLPCRQARTAGG